MFRFSSLPLSFSVLLFAAACGGGEPSAPDDGSAAGAGDGSGSVGGDSASDPGSNPGNGSNVSPPSPTDLVAMPVSSSSVSLTWRHPAAAQVLEYEVQRDGTVFATESASSVIDRGASSNARYCYRVRARGENGQLSEFSERACARTPAAGTDPNMLRGLTAQVTGSGSGGIVGLSDPCSETCSELFPADTVLTLTASEGAGSRFTGWVGCDGTDALGCDVILTSDRVVLASFTDGSAPEYRVTVVRSGSGSGSVSATGINCSSDCSKR